jgi:hypothetical protein
MSRPAPIRAAGLAAGLALAALAATVAAQAPRPEYLPYAEFRGDEPAAHHAVKQAYNEAVERYNKALYDYYVTLDRHDQLVEAFTRASNPAEQQKARAEAAPLRARLQVLRRDVTAAAAAVDQAKRRAAQAGVTLAP